MELKGKKIVITGEAGFLGTALVARLKARGVDEKDIFIPRRPEFDVRLLADCERAVQGAQIVIHLAANVGGIGYNREHPGELFYDNITMGTHMMEAARRAGVEKYVAVGTICAYPKFTPVPFKEENLWDGYPEESNAPYGLAKKMALVQAQSYRAQYGFNAIYLLPVNLYGPNDNFSLESSHVIPALIRKVHEAQKANKPFIDVWGTGRATREFLYVDDAAEGIARATERYDGNEPVNLGSGMEISIRELVETICRFMDYKGELHWDASKPDGQPRRMLDISLARKAFGLDPQVSFEQGLKNTILWYCEHADARKP